MAITFISKDSNQTILIGGAGSMSGADSGSVGPFPRYSINREDIVTGDGTYMNSKYTISITGTATLQTADSQDMLTSGQRQMRVQGEALKMMHFNRNEWPIVGNGKLTIASYGGLGNQLIFNDARLTSLELPEQNEETAGVQNLEYSFTFEANQESSGASANTGAGAVAKAPTYLLASAEENWDLAINEETGAFEDSNMSGNETSDRVFAEAPLYKTYTLTHTVTAQGVKKFAAGGAIATDGEAWRQAVEWVGTRLIDDPSESLTTDLMNNADGMPDNWSALYMDKVSDSTNLGVNLSADYQAYNHVRQIQSDIGAGTYTVTDTWVLSNDSVKSTHNVEISIEQPEDSDVIIVKTNGTINGLDTKTSGTNTFIDKYTNAKETLPSILSNSHQLARSVYYDAGYSGILNATVLSQNLSYNPLAGTITWDRSFSDETTTASGTIKEDVTVTYDNLDGSNQVHAIIGVLGRASGPIIQDMGVTNERKVSVSVDYTMDKEHRTNKPSGMDAALLHKPVNGYQQTKSESWSAKTGIYNLSISWGFNDSYDGSDDDDEYTGPPPGAL